MVNLNSMKWREMDKGNWVPMDKALVDALPTKRPYTLLEAVFSYQVDLSSSEIKSYRGYAKIWCWSLTKTVYFLKNAQSTKTEAAKDTHNTVKFSFIKPSEKSKEHSGDNSQTHPEDTPNKHNKKDINTKPIRDTYRPILKDIGNNPHTGKEMSFAEYLQTTTIEDKTKTVIEFYLKAYRTHMKKEHPRLKRNQWIAVIRTLFVCIDEKKGEHFDLSIDDLQRMIDRYFTTKFQQGCNYSIIHFNLNPIKLRRRHEID